MLYTLYFYSILNAVYDILKHTYTLHLFALRPDRQGCERPEEREYEETALCFIPFIFILHSILYTIY